MENFKLSMQNKKVKTALLMTEDSHQHNGRTLGVMLLQHSEPGKQLKM